MVGKVNIIEYENQKTTENVNIGAQLSELEKSQLKTLIIEYNDIFAIEPKSPQRTTLVEHRIETTDVVNYQKPRRIPFAWEDDVDTQITEMLANNIIRPSKSPWSSPILLVKNARWIQ